MSIAEFKERVSCARSESEVHRVMHVDFAAVRGTTTELVEGLSAAQARLEHFASTAEGCAPVESMTLVE